MPQDISAAARGGRRTMYTERSWKWPFGGGFCSCESKRPLDSEESRICQAAPARIGSGWMSMRKKQFWNRIADAVSGIEKEPGSSIKAEDGPARGFMLSRMLGIWLAPASLPAPMIPHQTLDVDCGINSYRRRCERQHALSGAIHADRRLHFFSLCLSIIKSFANGPKAFKFRFICFKFFTFSAKNGSCGSKRRQAPPFLPSSGEC